MNPYVFTAEVAIYSFKKKKKLCYYLLVLHYHDIQLKVNPEQPQKSPRYHTKNNLKLI